MAKRNSIDLEGLREVATEKKQAERKEREEREKVEAEEREKAESNMDSTHYGGNSRNKLNPN